MLLKNYFKINKKSLIILLVFILIFSVVTYAQKDKSLPEQAAKGKDVAQAQKEKFCETDEIEESLKKILYLHLTKQDPVPLTLDEIKDLLSFYLNIEEGAATARCSAAVLGFLSKRPILDIMNIGINLPDKIPVCSDGTKYGKCSIKKPLHCTARGVVDRCQKCGCPSGSVCSKSTGKCTPTDQTIICFSDLDCEKSGFTGNYYCNNNSITKDYVNYTCENPGTANSRCVSATSSKALEYCDPNLNKLCVDGAGSCQATAVTCSDGTQNGQCSLTKPLYCKDGALVNNCGVCGCAKGKVCSSAGACVDKTTETTAKFDIIRITTDPNYQFIPRIYGDKIVWVDTRNGNHDIYMYDLSTGQETPITTDAVWQEWPDIYENKIVWEESVSISSDIFMYDISTGKKTQITKNTGLQIRPVIYGDKIAWLDYRNGNQDVYMYDISTGKETQVTTNTKQQFAPSIHGNKIVWSDQRNENNSRNGDVYMYDISTGQETRITTSPANEGGPVIYGDKIVWQDSRNNLNIYMYDLSTGQETPITKNTAGMPVVWVGDMDIYGDRIVWADQRNDYGDIYMYDLLTNQETRITTNIQSQQASSIYGNKIVWEDDMNGNSDIYMATIY